MKIILIITLVVTIALSCKTERNISSVDAVSISNSENIKKIDSLINNLVVNNKSAGFQLGVLIGDSEPVLKEYGFSNFKNKKKVKSTDQFRIASITKTFTATAILKLVELGKLSLNDTFDKFFKNYPNGKEITIYHLLSHTSGIPNWWDGEIQGEVPIDFPMCKYPHK